MLANRRPVVPLRSADPCYSGAVLTTPTPTVRQRRAAAGTNVPMDATQALALAQLVTRATASAELVQATVPGDAVVAVQAIASSIAPSCADDATQEAYAELCRRVAQLGGYPADRIDRAALISACARAGANRARAAVNGRRNRSADAPPTTAERIEDMSDAKLIEAAAQLTAGNVTSATQAAAILMARASSDTAEYGPLWSRPILDRIVLDDDDDLRHELMIRRSMGAGVAVRPIRSAPAHNVTASTHTTGRAAVPSAEDEYAACEREACVVAQLDRLAPNVRAAVTDSYVPMHRYGRNVRDKLSGMVTHRRGEVRTHRGVAWSDAAAQLGVRPAELRDAVRSAVGAERIRRIDGKLTRERFGYRVPMGHQLHVSRAERIRRVVGALLAPATPIIATNVLRMPASSVIPCAVPTSDYGAPRIPCGRIDCEHGNGRTVPWAASSGIVTPKPAVIPADAYADSMMGRIGRWQETLQLAYGIRPGLAVKVPNVPRRTVVGAYLRPADGWQGYAAGTAAQVTRTGDVYGPTRRTLAQLDTLGRSPAGTVGGIPRVGRPPMYVRQALVLARSARSVPTSAAWLAEHYPADAVELFATSGRTR